MPRPLDIKFHDADDDSTVIFVCGRGHNLLIPENQLLRYDVSGNPNIRCRPCKESADRASYNKRKAKRKLVEAGCRVLPSDECKSISVLAALVAINDRVRRSRG